MKRSENHVEELKRILGKQPMLVNKLKAQKFFSRQKISIEDVQAGVSVIEEGQRSKEIVLIVDGRFEVDIGGAIVGERTCTHVGEMAMMMDGARSASVTAVTRGRVIRVPEEVMRKVLKNHPEIWEPLMETLCARLHERRLFFRQSNKIPKMFIGSSGKNRMVAEDLAREIRQLIPPESAQVSVWTEDIFQVGDQLISKLSEQARISDFGAFIFAADDVIIRDSNRHSSRGCTFTTRANVVFEAGMFVGSCGLERTFIVRERSKKMDEISDLGGVVYAEYSSGIDRSESLRKVAEKLARAIKSKGVIRSTRERSE